MRTTRFYQALGLGALAFLGASRLHAQTSAVALAPASVRDSEPARTQTLEERVQELDQHVRVLERLRELERDSLIATTKTQTKISGGRDGFTFKSGDGAFQLKINGYFQADDRFFPGGESVGAPTNAFLLRRVRPVIDATVYRIFALRLVPDFGNGQTVLFDAYWEARLSPAFALRAGKFKPPVGLERLQSAVDIAFAERGFPTGLVPTRDIGIQISGDLAGGILNYAAGVFDGTPDLGNADSDAGDAKDFVGRVFIQPFRRRGTSELGFGIAASTGIERGTLAAPALASYRSPGQATIFRYRTDGSAPNTAYADGQRTRVAPQGYVYTGPVGLLAEYTISRQEIRRATTLATLEQKAWEVTGSFVLTGERASFRGVTPKRPFDPRTKGFGAVELVARYGTIDLDDDAFPVFANPASAATEAKAWAVGLTWHLAREVKIQVNYERTTFTGGAATGDREPETFVVTRFQHTL